MSNLSYVYKLNRATEHLQLIHDELVADLGTDAYETIDESEIKEVVNGMRRIKVIRRARFKKAIPLLRLGVLVGDVISNLRSALDHIVYAISFSRDPDGFKNDRTTEFPICDNADTFNRPRRRDWGPRHQIRGLPPDAQAIIEGLQPYHGGKIEDDPLWRLREMSNLDKHRSIHITTFSAYQLAWDITKLYPHTVVHSHYIRPPGKVEDGGILAEVEISHPEPVPENGKPVMEMNKQFLLTVAFDQDTPLPGQFVEEGLSYLAVYTQGICAALNRFIRS